MEREQSTSGLTAEELEEHAVQDLPDREAMSLIKPGLGLIEGNIVQPGGPPIAGPAPEMPGQSELPADPTAPTDPPEMTAQPAPEPQPEPRPYPVEPLPPSYLPAEDTEPQPYTPVASDTATV